MHNDHFILEQKYYTSGILIIHFFFFFFAKYEHLFTKFCHTMKNTVIYTIHLFDRLSHLLQSDSTIKHHHLSMIIILLVENHRSMTNINCLRRKFYFTVILTYNRYSFQCFIYPYNNLLELLICNINESKTFF